GVVDRRSDIYSLGATLLCIIGNIQNPNSQLHLITNLETPQFDDFDKELRPLWSICKKAMVQDPELRYQAVEELVLDVENFLADQPVKAHSESWTERLTRNSRRYRSIVNTALIGLTCISLMAIGAALWINAERRNAVAAKNEALNLKSQAEKLTATTQTALRQVSRTKSQLETLTDNQRNILETFSHIFSGPGACNYGGELTLSQGLEQLIANSKKSDKMVQGFIAGIQARRKKAMHQSEESVAGFRSSIMLLSQSLNKGDPLILEHKIGLATALTKQAEGYNPGSPERKKILEEALATAESVIDSATKNNTSKRIGYLAMTALPSIYVALGDVKAALRSAQNATEFGKDCYQSNHHHLLSGELLTAGMLRANGQLEPAKKKFRDIANMIVESEPSKLALKVTAFRGLHWIAMQEAKMAHGDKRFAEFIALTKESKSWAEKALELSQDPSVFGKKHPVSRDIELKILNADDNLKFWMKSDIVERRKNFWLDEIELTSAGSRRAAVAAYYYCKILSRMPDTNSKVELNRVIQTTLEAIESEQTQNRIQIEVQNQLRAFKTASK
ncbi:MAG: hypothetical protein AAGA30_11380, partial [Planctomycetota bacterium]